MLKKEAETLLEALARAKKQIASEIEDVMGEINGLERWTPDSEAFPVKAGDTVRVFATNAIEDERECVDVNGLECQVLECPNLNDYIYGQKIEVEVLDKTFLGRRFKVFPQQCYPVKGSK